MAAFAYPKYRHTRRVPTPVYTDYPKYKPYLQREFERVCVYCRVPDTIGRADFSIDHYRPQAKFPRLVATYSNLFYSCSKCNRRKSAYWPAKLGDPEIPNPCDYVMTEHMRVVNGEVQAGSQHGEHAIKRLDLNEPAYLNFRKTALSVIRQTRDKIAETDKKLGKLRKKLAAGDVSKARYDEWEAKFIDCKTRLTNDLAIWMGTVPLPP